MPQGLLAIADACAEKRLNRYLDCLRHWAPKINLTGAETRETAFRTLVFPILGAETLLFGAVVDVGSGNGSPGLILAVLRPDLDFTLLEPRAKRWAFLREAAREMGVENVAVRRERSDQYHGPKAGTVTMRAVGMNPIEVHHLLAPGGCVLVFGGPCLSGTETHHLAAGSTVQRRCFT